jgi:hypothetical protein
MYCIHEEGYVAYITKPKPIFPGIELSKKLCAALLASIMGPEVMVEMKASLSMPFTEFFAASIID